MSKFDNISDKELVDEVYARDLTDDVLSEIDDDDLVQMVRGRNLEECFESDNEEEVDPGELEEEIEKDFKASHFILSKDFDRFQLRDHLLDIARLQSHCSDKKLFDTLSDLLEFA